MSSNPPISNQQQSLWAELQKLQEELQLLNNQLTTEDNNTEFAANNAALKKQMAGLQQKLGKILGKQTGMTIANVMANTTQNKPQPTQAGNQEKPTEEEEPEDIFDSAYIENQKNLQKINKTLDNSPANNQNTNNEQNTETPKKDNTEVNAFISDKGLGVTAQKSDVQGGLGVNSETGAIELLGSYEKGWELLKWESKDIPLPTPIPGFSLQFTLLATAKAELKANASSAEGGYLRVGASIGANFAFGLNLKYSIAKIAELALETTLKLDLKSEADFFVQKGKDTYFKIYALNGKLLLEFEIVLRAVEEVQKIYTELGGDKKDLEFKLPLGELKLLEIIALDYEYKKGKGNFSTFEIKPCAGIQSIIDVADSAAAGFQALVDALKWLAKHTIEFFATGWNALIDGFEKSFEAIKEWSSDAYKKKKQKARKMAAGNKALSSIVQIVLKECCKNKNMIAEIGKLGLLDIEGRYAILTKYLLNDPRVKDAYVALVEYQDVDMVIVMEEQINASIKSFKLTPLQQEYTTGKEAKFNLAVEYEGYFSTGNIWVSILCGTEVVGESKISAELNNSQNGIWTQEVVVVANKPQNTNSAAAEWTCEANIDWYGSEQKTSIPIQMKIEGGYSNSIFATLSEEEIQKLPSETKITLNKAKYEFSREEKLTATVQFGGEVLKKLIWDRVPITAMCITVLQNGSPTNNETEQQISIEQLKGSFTLEVPILDKSVPNKEVYNTQLISNLKKIANYKLSACIISTSAIGEDGEKFISLAQVPIEFE